MLCNIRVIHIRGGSVLQRRDGVPLRLLVESRTGDGSRGLPNQLNSMLVIVFLSFSFSWQNSRSRCRCGGTLITFLGGKAVGRVAHGHTRRSERPSPRGHISLVVESAHGALWWSQRHHLDNWWVPGREGKGEERRGREIEEEGKRREKEGERELKSWGSPWVKRLGEPRIASAASPEKKRSEKRECECKLGRWARWVSKCKCYYWLAVPIIGAGFSPRLSSRDTTVC